MGNPININVDGNNTPVADVGNGQLTIEAIFDVFNAVETSLPDEVWNLLANFQATKDGFTSLPYHQEHIQLIQRYIKNPNRQKEVIVRMIQQLVSDYRVYSLDIALFYAQYLIDDYTQFFDSENIEGLKHGHEIKDKLKELLYAEDPADYEKGVQLVYALQQIIYKNWGVLSYATEIVWLVLGIDQKSFDRTFEEGEEQGSLGNYTTIDEDLDAFTVGKVLSTLVQLESRIMVNQEKKISFVAGLDKPRIVTVEEEYRHMMVPNHYVYALKNTTTQPIENYAVMADQAMAYNHNELARLIAHTIIHGNYNIGDAEHLGDVLMKVAYHISDANDVGSKMIMDGALRKYTQSINTIPYKKIAETAEFLSRNAINMFYSKDRDSTGQVILPEKGLLSIEEVIQNINELESYGGNMHAFQLYLLYLELTVSHLHSGNIGAAGQAYERGKEHRISPGFGYRTEASDAQDQQICSVLDHYREKAKSKRDKIATSAAYFVTVQDDESHFYQKESGEASIILGQWYQDNGNTTMAHKHLIRATYCHDKAVAKEGHNKYNEYFGS